MALYQRILCITILAGASRAQFKMDNIEEVDDVNRGLFVCFKSSRAVPIFVVLYAVGVAQLIHHCPTTLDELETPERHTSKLELGVNKKKQLAKIVSCRLSFDAKLCFCKYNFIALSAAPFLPFTVCNKKHLNSLANVAIFDCCKQSIIYHYFGPF